MEKDFDFGHGIYNWSQHHLGFGIVGCFLDSFQNHQIPNFW